MTDRAPLTERERGFLALVLRSPDLGEGWRSVSATLWPMVTGFTRPELIETWEAGDARRVRLTEAGQIVVRYL